MDMNSVKARALQDAKQMQQYVIETATKTGSIPPRYVLTELIGRGTYGRVYKARDVATAAVVAVKIIDVDASDTENPRCANSASEILKEIRALNVLREKGARNINHVINADVVGHTVWIVTEYCGGGSISTLMKRTPRGLCEKWIIPILREVAEAIIWVHEAGMVHRDIKGANVLVTEHGNVQLCDFGVAGVVSSRLDKRTTFVGTLHWMAPEMFNSSRHYGREVDIWAFGCLAYELANGIPPYVGLANPHGTHMESALPTLEGDQYSAQLQSLITYCLEPDWSLRPSAAQVYSHPYLHASHLAYPTSTLSDLVRAFRVWEAEGGARNSLFGGDSAAASTRLDYDWDFDTESYFDKDVTPDTLGGFELALQIDAGLHMESLENLASLSASGPSYQSIEPNTSDLIRSPLEKLFDNSTISNYESNSSSYYDQMSQYTVKARRPRGHRPRRASGKALVSVKRESNNDGVTSISKADVQADTAALEDRRVTLEWKFPTLPASQPHSTIETSSLPDDEIIHQAMPRYKEPGPGYIYASRIDQEGDSNEDDVLIDLDISTTHLGDTSNTIAQRLSLAPSPTDLDLPTIRPKSTTYPVPVPYPTESEETSPTTQTAPDEPNIDTPDETSPKLQTQFPPPSTTNPPKNPLEPLQFPIFPPPPPISVMTGTATDMELLNETTRLLNSLAEHLVVFHAQYTSLIDD